MEFGGKFKIIAHADFFACMAVFVDGNDLLVHGVLLEKTTAKLEGSHENTPMVFSRKMTVTRLGHETESCSFDVTFSNSPYTDGKSDKFRQIPTFL
jgi:hypothetical protein